MVALRDKRHVPAPDQYLEQVDEADIIMLDPLCLLSEQSKGGGHTFLQ